MRLMRASGQFAVEVQILGQHPRGLEPLTGPLSTQLGAELSNFDKGIGNFVFIRSQKARFALFHDCGQCATGTANYRSSRRQCLHGNQRTGFGSKTWHNQASRGAQQTPLSVEANSSEKSISS